MVPAKKVSWVLGVHGPPYLVWGSGKASRRKRTFRRGRKDSWSEPEEEVGRALRAEGTAAAGPPGEKEHGCSWSRGLGGGTREAGEQGLVQGFVLRAMGTLSVRLWVSGVSGAPRPPSPAALLVRSVPCRGKWMASLGQQWCPAAQSLLGPFLSEGDRHRHAEV